MAIKSKQTKEEKIEEPPSSEQHKPDPKFRRFYLKRNEDVSGVSGTGYVAEGIQYSTGCCVLLWTGVTSCTSIWHSVYEMLAVHGHGGATVVVWVD